MSNIIKKNPRSFSFDVEMFQDLKIRKLIRRKGGQAVAVYTSLFCFIHRNGYFVEVDEDLAFLVAEQLNFEEEYVREVIECCVALGLFDQDIYAQHKVLTSEDIQSRYLKKKKKSRRIGAIADYSLLPGDVSQPPQPEKTPQECVKLEAAIEQMWTDSEWVEAKCLTHNLTPNELSGKLDRFAVYCRKDGKSDMMHRSVNDVKIHFNSWLRNNVSSLRV